MSSPEESTDIKRDPYEEVEGESEDVPEKTQDEELLEEVEEDDEELDEDEEDIRDYKKQRRNRFIDDIADVSEEEEDEDEDDEAAQEFIADQLDGGDEDLGTGNDSRIHRKFDRALEKEKDEDIEAIARDYKERYGKSSSKYRGDRVMVSQKLLMPSVNDPNIWAIRVVPGKEKDLVRMIMKKKLSLENSKTPLEIFSCFQRDNFSGYIYIEARKLEAVDQALKGLVNILFSRGKLLVPVAEYPDLLRPTKSSDVEIVPGIYVRIKRGIYKGDLAIVEDISENGLEVLCKVVPRLDYGRFDETDASGKRKRSKTRPAARLFNQMEAKTYDMKNPVMKEGANTFRYRNERYKDGFLYKDFKIQFLQTNDVAPSLAELSKFNVGDEGIDLSSVAAGLKQANQQSTTFQPGDRIEVIKGEQKGALGFVSSAERSDVVSIKLESDDYELNGRIFEIPASNLRKVFSTGDHVRVIHGKHTDLTGLVLAVENHQVTIVSDQTQKDVTVFANYLVKSTDATTNTQYGQYELHDLVQLNSQNFGIIIKVEREVFTILCQDGKVVNIAPSSISNKIKLYKDQTMSTDASGLEIKVGDTVKERTGERRLGVILHVYKSVLFLKSKTVIENNGVFVSNSSNVTTVATKGTLFKAPDLSKMNPNRQVADKPQLSTMSRSGGRDQSINQRVTINSGPYKTLQGIIKDANGEIARVELHTKSKVLSMDKSKLSFHLKNGQVVPYEKWLMMKGNSKGGPRNFAGSNGNDGMNNGGNRSAWSSNRASGGTWSGGQTAYGGNGGRTAYGGGTAYGGRTPGFGSKTPAWSSSGGNGGGSAWGKNGGGMTAYGNNGGGSAWGGNKTAYGGGSAWGGNRTSYGGASAWNPNSNNHDEAFDDSVNSAATPWNAAPTPAAPTPGISAPTPGAPTPGAPTPGDWD